MTQDLYNEILKSDLNKVMLTKFQLDQLKTAYVNAIVEDMTKSDLQEFVYNCIYESVSDMQQDDIEEEISGLYDEEFLTELMQKVDMEVG